jgi:2',3'-cyclic-nucleotide 2'-phosphodiesterase / 3'-nucleotidase / 5'-nucleotidase
MKAHSLLPKPILVTAFAVMACLPLQAEITVKYLGTHKHGPYNTAAAEIAAHHPATQRLFVVNAQANTVDVLDIADPAAPVLQQTISAAAFGGAANSVAVHGNCVAVAIEATVKQNPGKVLFLDAETLAVISSADVGALPDMVTFTPDGRYALTANEGEPDATYTVDPEGSVSIIDLGKGKAAIATPTVKTASFAPFNDKLKLDKAFQKEKLRVFGPNATVAQDIEPEYIAVSPNSKTAWVTLQENNAIAIVDISKAEVKDIRGLGVKNHSLANNGFGSSNALDASDRDSAINIAPWPVKGFYLPDTIASFQSGGETYLVLANEGDARDYSAFAEEVRVGSANYPLDPTAFPNAATLKQEANLGRLQATKTYGDTDGDGDFDEIYTFGGRSFSIRAVSGQLLWDSGDQLERITAEAYPTRFNASNTNNTFDSRSPAKGPEPEGVAVGQAYGRNYAFIGLERVGGIMVYDLTTPSAPKFVEYVNRRDFTKATNTDAAGDLGPEGVLFINAENSPLPGKPLLVISNEISGTTSLFEIIPAAE